MPKVRVCERVVTPEEWADETHRIQEAREQHRPLAPLPTFADFRHGLDETQDMPAVTMADLVEGGAA